MNNILITGLIVWWLIGTVSFIYFKRYYSDISIFDIIVALTLGGIFGLVTFLFAMKSWYGYNIFSQKILKKKVKNVPKTK